MTEVEPEKGVVARGFQNDISTEEGNNGSPTTDGLPSSDRRRHKIIGTGTVFHTSFIHR